MTTEGHSNDSGQDGSHPSEKQSQSPSSDTKELEGSEEELIECFGRCKWFNVAKGYGFITPEGDSAACQKDVFVYQSKIQMSGFRSLSEGERVRCFYKESPFGLEATKVTGPSGEDCQGSERRPKHKKKPDRCYNCCEEGHHAKECKCPPLPKRCHHCKSVDHLVADCVIKHKPQKGKSTDSEHHSPSSKEYPSSLTSSPPTASP